MVADDLLGSLKPGQAERIRKALIREPHDTVLWVGEPDPWVSVKQNLPVLSIVSVFLGAFPAIVIMLPSEHPSVENTAMKLVISVCLVIFALLFFTTVCCYAFFRERSKLFALTDKRALVLIGPISHEFANLEEIKYSKNTETGVTSFVFNEFDVRYPKGGVEHVRIGFTDLNAPAGDQVKSLMETQFNTKFK